MSSARTTTDTAVLCDHVYSSEKQPCAACIDKNHVIFSMANEITKLSQEKESLKGDIDELCKEGNDLKVKKSTRKPFSAVSIKSDLKMKFLHRHPNCSCCQYTFLIDKAICTQTCFLEREKSSLISS